MKKEIAMQSRNTYAFTLPHTTLSLKYHPSHFTLLTTRWSEVMNLIFLCSFEDTTRACKRMATARSMVGGLRTMIVPRFRSRSEGKSEASRSKTLKGGSLSRASIVKSRIRSKG